MAIETGEPFAPPAAPAPIRGLGGTLERARAWTARPDVRRVLCWSVVAVFVGLRVLAAIHRGGALDDGDIQRFREIGTTPGRPYLDFPVEYPIGAYFLLHLIGQFTSDPVGFGHSIVWLSVTLDLCLVVLVWRTWGARAALFQLVAGMFIARLLLARIDLAAVAVVAVAMWAWQRGRPKAAGGLLALGAGLKLWPAMLAMVLFGAARGRDRSRFAGAFAAVGAVTGLLWLVIGGVQGPVQVLTFRGAKGWEIESTVGVFVRLLQHGSAPIEQGAARLGVVPHWFGVLSWLVCAPLAGWVAWRGGRTGRLGLGWVASVGILLLASSLLSPQFLIWVLPGAAVAWVERERLVPILIGIASAATGYEMHDFGRMINGDRLTVALVIARNALLLVAVGVSIVRLVRDRRPVRGGDTIDDELVDDLRDSPADEPVLTAAGDGDDGRGDDLLGIESVAPH